MYAAKRVNVLKKMQRFALFGATATCIASAAAYCPHTYLLQKYKEIVALHRNGEIVPVNDKLKSLFDECQEDLKIPERERDQMEPFYVMNFDMFHAGFFGSVYGAIIGIPEYLSYEDELQIDLHALLINKESILWNREDADEMTNSLLLSKNAKKFALANEMLLAQGYGPLVNTILTPIIMGFTVFSCLLANHHFKLEEKAKTFKYIVYGASYIFGCGLWFMQRDLLNEYYIRNAQKKICELGPEYVEGGREFYTKLLKRNVVLREVMGEMGRRKFTHEGNQIHSIRREVPLTLRKSYFEQFVMETP